MAGNIESSIEQVAPPVGMRNATLAFRVRGDFYSPAFSHGDIVCCGTANHRAPQSHVPCVVKDADGNHYLTRAGECLTGPVSWMAAILFILKSPPPPPRTSFLVDKILAV